MCVGGGEWEVTGGAPDGAQVFTGELVQGHIS